MSAEILPFEPSEFVTVAREATAFAAIRKLPSDMKMDLGMDDKSAIFAAFIERRYAEESKFNSFLNRYWAWSNLRALGQLYSEHPTYSQGQIDRASLEVVANFTMPESCVLDHTFTEAVAAKLKIHWGR